MSAIINQIIRDLLLLLSGAWQVFKNWWIWFALLLGDGILLMLLLKDTGIDRQVSRFLVVPEGSFLRRMAGEFSYWGDWPTGSLLLILVLLVWGYVRRSRKLQMMALACLLASVFAGIGTNCMRMTVGRPRPFVQVEDGFYGPGAVLKFEKTDDQGFLNSVIHYSGKANRYQSFPSGHASTSVGTAVAILVISPPVGIPLCIGAGFVCWSRMALERHYPSDILVGSMMGIVAGICFGLAGRRSLVSRLKKPDVIEPEIVK
ncbi:MAG: phosphatase PAP2 family protein [Verrucomicrobiota bacterium]|nr:phosphatase PAP2 family protein [Verrucomicrobiota bacterium]